LQSLPLRAVSLATGAPRVCRVHWHYGTGNIQEMSMSKGMDQKKDQKKKPEKSLKEKRAEKRDKKSQ
jgi:hypothetical protein